MPSVSQDEFFGMFVSFLPNGQLDKRETLRKFEAAVSDYIKKSEEIKPIILSEIKAYGRLSESTLTNFVLHSMRLPVNLENQTKVKGVLDELVSSGQIVHLQNKGTTGRGRGTGYTLPSTTTKNTANSSNSQNAE